MTGVQTCALPISAVLILFFFSYVPMAGLVLAFKNFDYKAGLWKSPWYGLENFKFTISFGCLEFSSINLMQIAQKEREKERLNHAKVIKN